MCNILTSNLHFTDSCKICKSVDGGWSEYGDWSECTKTCGGGTQYTNRTCTEPVPNSCGSNCTGDASKVRDCNVDPCPCSKVTVQNGTLDPDQSTYKSGDSFEVICYSGYSPEDVSLATVTCTDGELSDIPACSPGTLMKYLPRFLHRPLFVAVLSRSYM